MKSRKSIFIIILAICIGVSVVAAMTINTSMQIEDAVVLVQVNFGLEDADLHEIETIVRNLYSTGYFETREDAALAYIAARKNLEAENPEAIAIKLALFADLHGYDDFVDAAIFIRNQAHYFEITNEEYLNQMISE